MVSCSITKWPSSIQGWSVTKIELVEPCPIVNRWRRVRVVWGRSLGGRPVLGSWETLHGWIFPTKKCLLLEKPAFLLVAFNLALTCETFLVFSVLSSYMFPWQTNESLAMLHVCCFGVNGLTSEEVSLGSPGMIFIYFYFCQSLYIQVDYFWSSLRIWWKS